MQYHTFHHLGQDWEAAILPVRDHVAAVRFRDADDRGSRRYEGRIDADELEDVGEAGRDLALRRALESALVLSALEGQDRGLTADEVAERTGIPPEATQDRLHALDSVQPVPVDVGPRRYRVVSLGDRP
jgi:hypothetical protein